MNNLFLIVIAGILFIVLLKPDKDYKPNQTEIQDLTYVYKEQYIKMCKI